VVYIKNSSGNFNSGSRISSENFLQEPEISLRIFSNKVEFCTHFVALPPPQYKYICIFYIYICLVLTFFKYREYSIE